MTATKTTTDRENRLANLAALMGLNYREAVVLPTFLKVAERQTTFTESEIMWRIETRQSVRSGIAAELRRVAATIEL